MNKPVEIHPAAEQELIEAAQWYEERASLGSDLIDEVLAVRDMLAERFETYTPLSDMPGVRSADVRRFPYRLICHSQPDRILVLAVAHERRRPAYWRDRLPE